MSEPICTYTIQVRNASKSGKPIVSDDPDLNGTYGISSTSTFRNRSLIEVLKIFVDSIQNWDEEATTLDIRVINEITNEEL